MDGSREIIVNGVKVTCYVDGSISKLLYGRIKRTFGTSDCNKGYLRVKVGGKFALVHRMIAQAFLSDWDCDLQVDHKLGNKTDNRPSQLRMATNTQNHRGWRSRVSGSSQFRGVAIDRHKGKWLAYYYIKRVRKDVGYYDIEKDAAIARDAAAREVGYPLEGMNFPELLL